MTQEELDPQHDCPPLPACREKKAAAATGTPARGTESRDPIMERKQCGAATPEETRGSGG